MMFQAFVKDHLRVVLQKLTEIIGTQESFDSRLIDIENTILDIKEKVGLPVDEKHKTSVAERMAHLRDSKTQKKKEQE